MPGCIYIPVADSCLSGAEIYACAMSGDLAQRFESNTLLCTI